VCSSDLGLLDVNVLMNYKREHVEDQAQDYRDWTWKLATTKAGRHAINGPGIYMNSIHNSITQVLYALDTPGINGTNPYVYHQTNMDGDSANDFWYTMRADCFTQRRNVPTAPWIKTPTQGILRGTVRDGSQLLDGATVTLSRGAAGIVKTDGSGFYAFLKLNPGIGFQASVTVPGYPVLAKQFDMSAGTVVTLDFNFDEPTPTPTFTPQPTSTPSPSQTPTPGGAPQWEIR